MYLSIFRCISTCLCLYINIDIYSCVYLHLNIQNLSKNWSTTTGFGTPRQKRDLCIKEEEICKRDLILNKSVWVHVSYALQPVALPLHMYIYVYIYTHTCTYPYVNIYVRVYTYIPICVCIYINAYICAYVYTESFKNGSNAAGGSCITALYEKERRGACCCRCVYVCVCVCVFVCVWHRERERERERARERMRLCVWLQPST